MKTRAQSIFFAALLACTSAVASAQTIYKTVDEEGRATFSDRAPAARPAAIPRRIGTVDVNEAARRLRQARLERTLGAEPGPGELIGNPGARTGSDRYWKRQEKLRIDVERALRRSNETLRIVVASR